MGTIFYYGAGKEKKLEALEKDREPPYPKL
jgi:hypothetical protein